jgi:hypothetical protein
MPLRSFPKPTRNRHTLVADKRPKRSGGQTLAEYMMLAGILGLIGVSGLAAFNGGFTGLFSLAKGGLSAGSAPVSGKITNAQIAKAFATPTPHVNTPSSLTPAPTLNAAQMAQLSNIHSILSSMNPADLPEVSGANSTTEIQKIIKSALLLTELATALEKGTAGQNPNTGFNLNDLIFEAKKVALSQFFLAGTLLEGPGTLDPATGKRLIVGPNVTRGFDLLKDLVDMRPSDPEVQHLVSFYNGDYYDLDGARQIIQYNSYFGDYKRAYQPLESAIQAFNIQTQQAATILTNGGNINGQKSANGNGNQTMADINALKACKNVTCH